MKLSKFFTSLLILSGLSSVVQATPETASDVVLNAAIKENIQILSYYGSDATCTNKVWLGTEYESKQHFDFSEMINVLKNIRRDRDGHWKDQHQSYDRFTYGVSKGGQKYIVALKGYFDNPYSSPATSGPLGFGERSVSRELLHELTHLYGYGTKDSPTNGDEVSYFMTEFLVKPWLFKQCNLNGDWVRPIKPVIVDPGPDVIDYGPTTPSISSVDTNSDDWCQRDDHPTKMCIDPRGTTLVPLKTDSDNESGGPLTYGISIVAGGTVGTLQTYVKTIKEYFYVNNPYDDEIPNQLNPAIALARNSKPMRFLVLDTSVLKQLNKLDIGTRHKEEYLNNLSALLRVGPPMPE